MSYYAERFRIVKQNPPLGRRRATRAVRSNASHLLVLNSASYGGVSQSGGVAVVEGDSALIRLESVYKIFGPQPHGRAFDLARAGVSKDEVLRQSGHVIGIRDVNFSVSTG